MSVSYHPASPVDEENVFDEPPASTMIQPIEPSEIDIDIESHSRHPADIDPPSQVADDVGVPLSGDVNPFDLGPEATQAAIASLPPAPPRFSFTPEKWANMFWATASNKERLQQFMYARVLELSLTCQILMLFVSPH